MTEFVSITIKWYPPGQSGPNECDLMRAMQDVAMLYKADGGTDAEIGCTLSTGASHDQTDRREHRPRILGDVHHANGRVH